MLQKPSQLIRSVNIETYPFGAIRKRGGYSPFLGTPDNNQVNGLFDWHLNDGTTFYLYRASGSVLYYSAQGTTDWAPTGNGTMTNGFVPGYTVLENTLIVGDGTAETRSSTNGTSFTSISVSNNAPRAQYWSTYQGRVWAGGTSTSIFYSTGGTATDWTSDSGAKLIGGPGRISSLFTASDRLIITKNSGNIFRYDGNTFVDTATKLGPSSFTSFGEVEDNRFWLNRYGFFSYAGDKPILKSNPVERQIYNALDGGIGGTVFDSAPGVCHYYDYFCSIGTVTDDLTGETVANCVMKYNFQKDDWTNYQLSNNPTAWYSFVDNERIPQIVFGDKNGQCYIFDGSTSDNGTPISAVGEMILNLGNLLDKEFKWLALAFNPGCQAVVQVATADTFNKESLKWLDLGDVSQGKIEFHFPPGSRGTFLRFKFIESSENALFNFYGFECNYTLVTRN